MAPEDADARRPSDAAVIEAAATEVFAERGYQAATIDEIARRSGVSAPVVYDHFESKADLHARLLERHLAEMRSVWAAHLTGDEPAEMRIPRALDAWFAYVESHPYAWRMIFRDTSGDAEVQAAHREIQAQSSRGLLPLLETLPGGHRDRGRRRASSRARWSSSCCARRSPAWRCGGTTIARCRASRSSPRR